LDAKWSDEMCWRHPILKLSWPPTGLTIAPLRTAEQSHRPDL
jgi:hypothetical protein